MLYFDVCVTETERLFIAQAFIPTSVSLCANYQPAVIVSSSYSYACTYCTVETYTDPSHSPDVCSTALQSSPDDTHGLSCFTLGLQAKRGFTLGTAGSIFD